MDANLLEVMKIFVQLLYSVSDSTNQIQSLPKDRQKSINKLIKQAKKVLRNQNMQMSLASIDMQEYQS